MESLNKLEKRIDANPYLFDEQKTRLRAKIAEAKADETVNDPGFLLSYCEGLYASEEQGSIEIMQNAENLANYITRQARTEADKITLIAKLLRNEFLTQQRNNAANELIGNNLQMKINTA